MVVVQTVEIIDIPEHKGAAVHAVQIVDIPEHKGRAMSKPGLS